jgi:predicted RNase H-like HicB family nuclease
MKVRDVMKEYLVVYERAGKNYSAYVPDLPGCVAAGDTLEETEQLIKEAIELYIEALRADGKPVPEPTTKARSVAVVA